MLLAWYLTATSTIAFASNRSTYWPNSDSPKRLFPALIWAFCLLLLLVFRFSLCRNSSSYWVCFLGVFPFLGFCLIGLLNNCLVLQWVNTWPVVTSTTAMFTGCCKPILIPTMIEGFLLGWFCLGRENSWKLDKRRSDVRLPLRFFCWFLVKDFLFSCLIMLFLVAAIFTILTASVPSWDHNWVSTEQWSNKLWCTVTNYLSS